MFNFGRFGSSIIDTLMNSIPQPPPGGLYRPGKTQVNCHSRPRYIGSRCTASDFADYPFVRKRRLIDATHILTAAAAVESSSQMDFVLTRTSGRILS
jgi:hypothetical protein